MYFICPGVKFILGLCLHKNSCMEVLCEKGVLGRPEACNFIKKETLTQVFSSEFCEIFQNTFIYRIPSVAASVSENLDTYL